MNKLYLGDNLEIPIEIDNESFDPVCTDLPVNRDL